MNYNFQNVSIVNQRIDFNQNAILTILNGTGNIFSLANTDWIEYVESRINVLMVKEPISQLSDLRLIVEHIENIRQILNIPVSQLARFVGVSRQSVYKWLERSSEPEVEKQERIIKLSQIADKFKVAEITHPESLLNMKLFDGKSLIDMLMLGKNTIQHVDVLIKEAKIMEQRYKQSGILTSKAPPTNNWQSSISIPGSLEDQ